VVDDASILTSRRRRRVTSANLTEAALDRNIELGVLLRDRALALTISSYFRSLIDRDLLKPLPLA
jgi:phosphatidylserine/phosphatidylglycerophosphate/cardiolipin synthase-like enzyme